MRFYASRLHFAGVCAVCEKLQTMFGSSGCFGVMEYESNAQHPNSAALGAAYVVAAACVVGLRGSRILQTLVFFSVHSISTQQHRVMQWVD